MPIPTYDHFIEPVLRFLAALQSGAADEGPTAVLKAARFERFGAVVRHHELGYRANAMTVIEAPPARVDGIGAAIDADQRVRLLRSR